MFPPIRPSPTIPTCMRSSGSWLPRRRASRLDGLAEPGQSVLHIGPEMHAQRAAPALPQHLEVAERLSGLHDAERVSATRHREIVGVVAGNLDEHPGIRAALVGLSGPAQISRPEADTGRDP